MDRPPAEEDCINAFKNGTKCVAERILPFITRPKDVRTTFLFRCGKEMGLVSLVHLAAYWGWKDIAILLINVYHCSANYKDDNGHIPLNYAASQGQLELVKYFITTQQCNPMKKDRHSNTPLHIASIYGRLNITEYLVSEVHCNASCKNDHGKTPLHYACEYGHLNITRYLIETKCNPACENINGKTALHYACRHGELEIVRYLLNKALCNPLHRDKYGDIPLHHACQYGQLKVAQYLVSDAHCNPSCRNSSGRTPLHYASCNGHLTIVLYLISDKHCDPSCEDNHGRTPLHYACMHGHANIVQHLLSTGQVNPLAKDESGYTPLYYARSQYDILRLFQPFKDSITAFPVHTFTKVILTGDSGAGKSTTAELLLFILGGRTIIGIDRFTAGIIPHNIESKLGNFVVYDFAGQQEYFSSHAAILEQVMCKSPAIFLCMIDLSKSKEEICQSLHYWLSFIENVCSTANGTSHVVIVGSHADLVKSTEEIEEKSSLLQAIATRRVNCQEYVGYFAMNCHQVHSNTSYKLIFKLASSQMAIIGNQPIISYYCHVLYAFLCEKLKMVGCSLQDLISAITYENDCSLPDNPSVLTELLRTLSGKGLILFINHPNSSWVVVKTEVLLKEINGTLFAPRHLKEYRNLASNTGIVHTSNLEKVFPQYNLQMVVGFLKSLQFCCQVDHSVLQYTNLQTTLTSSTTDLIFFPGLIRSERPDGLIQQATLQFGWCLGCMDSEQFFSSRFLHVLLLSVAYKFPLASRFIPSSSLSGLQRMCIVWRNGISWSDDDDITVVVELLDNNRWVMVAMSCDKDSPVKHAKLRSSLISLVRHLQQERCPSLRLYECLISPELVQRYPFKEIAHTDLFDIHHVARSILLKKKAVRSYKDGCGRLSAQSLPFEPYQLLSPSSVCQLFNPSLSNQPVPAPLLQEVQEVCNCHSKAMPLVYKELRHYLDSMSIFAGRNPLVSK